MSAVVAAMAGMGARAGLVGRSSVKWRDNIAVRQMRQMDYQAHLDQLADIWTRADATGQDGLDPEEFEVAFRGHFPPWKRPADAHMSAITLDRLFRKIDANGDGRVSWEEFSDFVMSEAMASSLVEKEDISIFADHQLDCPYNDHNAYHKEMVTGLVIVPEISKIVTCSSDATIRVWSATTLQHLQTIKISEKETATWFTGMDVLLGFKSGTFPFGILAAASDRFLWLYDLKSFGFIGAVALGDDISPLCCYGFQRQDKALRMKYSDAQYFIAIGDAEGRVHLYEQTDSFLSKRERHPLSQKVKLPEDKGPASIMTVKAHSDHITQIKYINDIDKLVTTSLDSNICLIDLVTKEHVYYIGHAKSVHCVCFVSTHKYMASSGQERDIEIWNPYTQKRTTALTGHSACVKSIVFNPTHAHLITMSIDKNIIIWNPKTYERLCSVLDIEHEYRPENTFTCMEWNNRSKTLILAHSRLQIWPYRGDANEGLGLVLHKNRILAGLHNPSFANIVTIDESGLVIVWKLDSGEQITVWSIKHFAEEKITAAAFDKSDRRLMIGTSKGRVWLYNWNSGVRLNDLESDMDSEVSCVLNTISSAKKMDAARGHTVASGWNKHVYVWKDPPDTYSVACIRKIDLQGQAGLASDVQSMTWNQELKLIAFAMYDGLINTWETAGNWKRKLTIVNRGPPALLRKTSKHMARKKSGLLDQGDLTRSNTMKLESDQQRADREFLGKDAAAINAISCLSKISSNHIWITAGMDGSVHLFDCLDGSLRGQFDAGHLSEKPGVDGDFDRMPVLCMASDLDQTTLATADDQGSIKTFELSTALDEVITLKFTIHGAQELIAADANGLSDPYVKVAFRAGPQTRQEAQTQVIQGTLNPNWEEDFNFLVGSGNRHEIMKPHWTLHFTVFDYDRFGGHDELGVTSFDVNSLAFGLEKKQWLTLADPDPAPGVLPKPHGRVQISVCLDVAYNQPEVISEWQAHDGTILNMQLTKPSTTLDGSPIPLIISCAVDNKIKVWTVHGVLIGNLGFSSWDSRTFEKARNQGQRRRVEMLMLKQKNQDDVLDLQRKKMEKERREKDLQLEEDSERMQEESEERERRLAHEAAKREYIKRLESSDDLNDRLKAVSEKMGIPNETYHTLNQPLLDQILAGKGRQGEELVTVYSKVHIAGQSQKAYTIKNRAVLGWNFDRLRDIGVLTKANVEYGVVDVEKVPWQDEYDEFSKMIVPKPVNTVAALYRQQHIDRGYPLPSDSVPRSKSPNPDTVVVTSGTQSGAASRGGASERHTPVNSTIKAFMLPDKYAEASDQRDRHKIGSLSATGFTQNLSKLLKSSLPPHKPTGSWIYKKFEVKDAKTVTAKELQASDVGKEAATLRAEFNIKDIPPHIIQHMLILEQQRIERSKGSLCVNRSVPRFNPMQYISTSDSETGPHRTEKEQSSAKIQQPHEKDPAHQSALSYDSLQAPSHSDFTFHVTKNAGGGRRTQRPESIVRLEISGPFSARGRPQTARNSTPRIKKLDLSDLDHGLLAKPKQRPNTARLPTSRMSGLDSNRSRRDALRQDTANALAKSVATRTALAPVR